MESNPTTASVSRNMMNPPREDDDEIDLLKLWQAIWRRK